jgi:hypothetical protein
MVSLVFAYDQTFARRLPERLDGCLSRRPRARPTLAKVVTDQLLGRSTSAPLGRRRNRKTRSARYRSWSCRLTVASATPRTVLKRFAACTL